MGAVPKKIREMRLKPLIPFMKKDPLENLSPLSDPPLESTDLLPCGGVVKDPTLAHGGKSGASGGTRIVGASARGGRPDRPSRTMAGLPVKA